MKIQKSYNSIDEKPSREKNLIVMIYECFLWNYIAEFLFANDALGDMNDYEMCKNILFKDKEEAIIVLP